MYDIIPTAIRIDYKIVGPYFTGYGFQEDFYYYV
jgi:hypothetical protein